MGHDGRSKGRMWPPWRAREALIGAVSGYTSPHKERSGGGSAYAFHEGGDSSRPGYWRMKLLDSLMLVVLFWMIFTRQ